MNLTEIRQELHDYIDSADESHLKIVYEILQATDSEHSFPLSEEHRQILEERLKAYYENPTDVITWEEIMEKYGKK